MTETKSRIFADDEHGGRPLSNTTVIEDMFKLRDEEFNKNFPCNGKVRRYDMRSVKRKMLEMPDT